MESCEYFGCTLPTEEAHAGMHFCHVHRAEVEASRHAPETLLKWMEKSYGGPERAEKKMLLSPSRRVRH